MAGERRRATIVFSDLAGYTAMNERLDPEEVEALMSRIKEGAVGIVERHGGMVNQFVGDEVLALFGIPTAHEDDPARAVRAARELHTLVREMSPAVETRLEQPLRMHTGIHTGLVVTNRRDDRDGRVGVVGNTVNVSARLKALAGADEVLVSSETQRLVAPYFETEARPALLVKGKREPLVPHLVTAASMTKNRFEAAAQRGLVPHTGRTRELAVLTGCLDMALAGGGQLVTVSGDAGMGKSRLLHEFSRMIEGHVRVLRGTCQPAGAPGLYQPFMSVLRGLLALGDCNDPKRVVDRTAEALEALDPALSSNLLLYLHLLSIADDGHDLPMHLRGDLLRHATDSALTALLLASSRSQPLVLMLEDWHWADEASNAALAHLVPHLAEAAILLVLTHRPDRPSDWPGVDHHVHLALQPLMTWQIGDVVTSIMEVDELPDDLLAVLQERTGGNPFFIEEVCRSLREEGVLEVVNGHITLHHSPAELSIPDTVQAIIRTRLDRLDDDARELLRLASVVGKRFARQLLAQLHPDQPLQELLDRLLAGGMIEELRTGPEVEYMFHQELTQEVAYESLRLAQRKRLHALVGAAIETLYPHRIDDHAEVLRHHFSVAGDWAKAVTYGRRAAERAATLCQFERAITLFDEVLAWLPELRDPETETELVIEMGLRQEQLYDTLGRRGEQQAVISRMFERLAGSSAPARIADVYVRQGDLFTQLDRFDEAETALYQALTIRHQLDDPAGEALVRRSLGFLRWHQGQLDEAEAENQAALALDRARGDVGAVATDLTNLGAVLRSAGEYERALTCLGEALALYEQIDQPARQALTLYSMANIAREKGALDLALAQYQRAHAIFTEHHDPVLASRALAGIAALRWSRGEYNESLRLSEEVVRMTREAGYGHGLCHALRTLGEHLIARGRHGRAVPLLVEGAELFAALGDRRGEAELLATLAAIYEDPLDEPEQAYDAWRRAGTLLARSREPEAALAALVQAARVARDLMSASDLADPPARAREATDAALALGAEFVASARKGELFNTLGILAWRGGDYEQALRCYRHARDGFQAAGAHGHEGLILNSIGVTLHKLGRIDEARDRLNEAIAWHRRNQQPLLEGHALAALGDVQREQGALDEALADYQASLTIRTAIGDRRGEGWMHHALAEVLRARGESAEAESHAQRARAIAEEQGDAELARAAEPR
ncbi:ATP-binding protein [Haliangium sp.]|uniref:ATP-binding protein n=1 Tax=Haliangium sp. TaxID=2663208 RepID=UPI003D0AC22C